MEYCKAWYNWKGTIQDPKEALFESVKISGKEMILIFQDV